MQLADNNDAFRVVELEYIESEGDHQKVQYIGNLIHKIICPGVKGGLPLVACRVAKLVHVTWEGKHKLALLMC